MVRRLRHSIFTWTAIFLLTLVSWSVSAQNIDAFARVSVSPREGVVRQPYKVTITVYSSTWFAKPLQFTNLRIDDAFIIPFTRTVSGINYINNKKYASLTFYYLVFPYSTGHMQIPELVINANIPPEGDYRGQDYTIRTKAQSIKISAVPSSKEEQVWMVAKNIRIYENWNRSYTKLKVGDVIEREIVINAAGTLPSLIKPLQVEEPEGASIYPQQADLQDKRNSQDVNGERTERYSYLFEEEGEVIIPKQEILWWNPETNRVYERTLPERILTIAPNPDLAMMESLKDSLLALNMPVELEEEERTFPWLRIAFFVVLAIGYYYLWKLGQSVVGNLKAKQAAYRSSEKWYFKQVKRAIQSGDRKEIINNLYFWFDLVRDLKLAASLLTVLNIQEQGLIQELVTGKSEVDSKMKRKLTIQVKALRIRILKDSNNEKDRKGLNPV